MTDIDSQKNHDELLRKLQLRMDRVEESIKVNKNIVVFSDGTGQEGGVGSNTNVYKLFQMVEDRTREQVAFYDAGLGTNWQKFTGTVSGSGITKNILECYQFISEQYQWGIGFSCSVSAGGRPPSGAWPALFRDSGSCRSRALIW